MRAATVVERAWRRAAAAASATRWACASGICLRGSVRAMTPIARAMPRASSSDAARAPLLGREREGRAETGVGVDPATPQGDATSIQRSDWPRPRGRAPPRSSRARPRRRDRSLAAPSARPSEVPARRRPRAAVRCRAGARARRPRASRPEPRPAPAAGGSGSPATTRRRAPRPRGDRRRVARAPCRPRSWAAPSRPRARSTPLDGPSRRRRPRERRGSGPARGDRG